MHPMRASFRRGLTAVALAMVAFAASPAWAEGQELRVGVVGSAPFVVREGGELSGISVGVWKDAARASGWTSKLVALESVPDALDAVARSEVDVLIGPISITAERAERVRFTQPYFESSLGILAGRASSSPFSRIAPFLSRAFAVGVAGLLVVLCAVGALIWLAERKKNPEQFPATPLAGIGNGIWLAVVTMTTVGYGDRAPITLAGRIVAGVWMVVALVTASSLTAGIATALTLAQLSPGRISSAEQLADQRVAAVRGTPGARFAKRMNAILVPVSSLEDGVARVESGDADALVFDRPMLLYHLQEHPDLDLRVSQASYVPQRYGFALPMETELQNDLNVALLRQTESGRVRTIAEEWLGREADGER